MKMLHHNKEVASDKEKRPYLIWMRETRPLETEDRDLAIHAYEKIRKVFPLKEGVYDRLLILYRKTKETEKEKKLLNEAISAFQEYYGSEKMHDKGKTVTRLSRSLSKSLGLTDKKGHPAYDIEPITRWNKRLALLKKKSNERPTQKLPKK